MRRFYEDVLGFPPIRERSPAWIEYRVGNNKVSVPAVEQCADDLVRRGVILLSPRADQRFGPCTLFSRDRKVFADIHSVTRGR